MLDGIKSFQSNGYVSDFALIAAGPSNAALRARLTEGGFSVCAVPAISDAMAVPDFAALMLDADELGGLAASLELAQRILWGPVPVCVVILQHDLAEQVFPTDPLSAPVLLRKPLSRLTLRVLGDYLRSGQQGGPETGANENGAQPPVPRPV